MGNAEIKDMRERLNKKGEQFYLREKELLREITLANRRTKNVMRRLESKIESNNALRQRIKELTS